MEDKSLRINASPARSSGGDVEERGLVLVGEDGIDHLAPGVVGARLEKVTSVSVVLPELIAPTAAMNPVGSEGE